MLDLLRRHLNNAVVHFAKALSQRLVSLGGETVVTRNEIVPNPHGPTQDDRFRRRHRGRWIGVTSNRFGDAKQLAGRNVESDDLLSGRGDPHHPNIAVQQHIETLRRGTFFKDRNALAEAADACHVQNLTNLPLFQL